jgi:hypothetical protein
MPIRHDWRHSEGNDSSGNPDHFHTRRLAFAVPDPVRTRPKKVRPPMVEERAGVWSALITSACGANEQGGSHAKGLQDTIGSALAGQCVSDNVVATGAAAEA